MGVERQVYNARISDMAPGVVTENIAEQITFIYDPVTTESFFQFHHRPYVYIQGQPKPMASPNTDSFGQKLSAILTKQFAQGLYDPITGIHLGDLSPAGFAIYLKAAFDQLFNENAKAHGYPDPDLPYPSDQAQAQANALTDMYGKPPAQTMALK